MIARNQILEYAPNFTPPQGTNLSRNHHFFAVMVCGPRRLVRTRATQKNSSPNRCPKQAATTAEPFAWRARAGELRGLRSIGILPFERCRFNLCARESSDKTTRVQPAFPSAVSSGVTVSTALVPRARDLHDDSLAKRQVLYAYLRMQTAIDTPRTAKASGAGGSHGPASPGQDEEEGVREYINTPHVFLDRNSVELLSSGFSREEVKLKSNSKRNGKKEDQPRAHTVGHGALKILGDCGTLVVPSVRPAFCTQAPQARESHDAAGAETNSKRPPRNLSNLLPSPHSL
ncbi:hypothetical protein SCHPADRAFT_491069 [Schizopora paradoxa]|uniref:Uncharacterized protein n=1 Tax=Schizopora paradoxa TaxID=27342 RepID=A0A0H2RNN0_9AGAM|nr:hypothetical protein SCHPADRAFT_491069 [Schizopora paradoxa]